MKTDLLPNLSNPSVIYGCYAIYIFHTDCIVEFVIEVSKGT